MFHIPLTVTEAAVSESRSRFACSLTKHIEMTCQTDDAECCTKALRLVSGSDTAVHPRDWPTVTLVFTGLEVAHAHLWGK